MTVRELVKILQKMNPKMDMEVEHCISDGGCYATMPITYIHVDDGVIVLDNT